MRAPLPFLYTGENNLLHAPTHLAKLHFIIIVIISYPKRSFFPIDKSLFATMPGPYLIITEGIP